MPTFEIAIAQHNSKTCLGWEMNFLSQSATVGQAHSTAEELLNHIARCQAFDTVLDYVKVRERLSGTGWTTILNKMPKVGYPSRNNAPSSESARLELQDDLGHKANIYIPGYPDGSVNRSSDRAKYTWRASLLTRWGNLINFLEQNDMLFLYTPKPPQVASFVISAITFDEATSTYTITAPGHALATQERCMIVGPRAADFPTIRGRQTVMDVTGDNFTIIADVPCDQVKYRGGLTVFEVTTAEANISSIFLHDPTRKKRGGAKNIRRGRRPNRKPRPCKVFPPQPS